MHCEAVTMAASEERKMWHLMDSPLAGFSYQNKSRTITVDGGFVQKQLSRLFITARDGIY